MINELGTEAIITPQGTLTALPSKTGIVPADITENLWELGELAPNFVKLIDRYPEYLSGKANASVTDESFNITNFTMTGIFCSHRDIVLWFAENFYKLF